MSAMRSRRLERCATCGLTATLCLCAELPRLTPATTITVIAHRTELFKSTNSGRLAVQMLHGASLLCRGGERTCSLESRPQGAWVLFPSADAVPLARAQALGVRTLIVPDGTWTQAKRIARRDPRCSAAPHVRLDAPRKSAYRLRRNAREDGLCTLEAVAEALRALEGDAVAEPMLAAFEVWMRRAERVRAGAHQMALP